MPENCSVAIDGGRVQCAATLDGDGAERRQHLTGKDWDFWLQASGKALYLNPQNQTMFADARKAEPGKPDCYAAPYKHGRYRVDTLPLGSRVCVLTGSRRHAELILESTGTPPAGPLSFAYVLWE